MTLSPCPPPPGGKSAAQDEVDEIEVYGSEAQSGTQLATFSFEVRPHVVPSSSPRCPLLIPPPVTSLSPPLVSPQPPPPQGV